MKSLNKYVWNKYALFGDEGFLHIDSTNSSIDGIRIKSGENNTVPYITRTDNNNGTTRFVAEENYTMGSDPGNCITVGLDTQTAFYQAHRFVTGQNIQVIYGATVNKFSALFYTTILRTQMVAKFNWGGNGATLGRMVRLEALLPSAANGNPDFLYMTEYIKAKQKEILDKYRAYAEKQLSKIEYKSVKPISEIDWKTFSIVDLFNTFIAGKGGGLNHLVKTDNGGINYIGATNRNNGVLCYVEDNETSKKKILPGNCIGFIKNGDGSAGYAIYKAESFISTNDVIYGYADWLNKYTGLFFVAAQDMIENKYSHGYKRNMEHLKGDKIMLPVNDRNEPDYAYMEQYAKNMMYRKYQQYLAYLDKKQHGQC